MNDPALPIVLNVIIKDDSILMIKRTLGDYIGYFGLPGGKIERIEHLAQAAEREAQEETNLKTKFQKLAGVVSEHLWDDDALKEHFLLFICIMDVINEDDEEIDNELLKWFPVDKLRQFEEQIIPSDMIIIKKFIIEKSVQYMECDMKQQGDKYSVMYTKFD